MAGVSSGSRAMRCARVGTAVVGVGLCDDYFCLALHAGCDASSGTLLQSALCAVPQCGRACLALDILHVARAFGLLSWTMLFHQSTHCLCSFSCFPVRFRAHPGQTGLQSRLVLHSFGVQHSLVVCRWSIWDVTTIIIISEILPVEYMGCNHHHARFCLLPLTPFRHIAHWR
jgi:hypothetical protein